MQFLLLDSVEVAPGELLKPTNWARKKGGRLVAPQPKKKTIPPNSVPYLVRRRRGGGSPRYSWKDKKLSSLTGGIYRLSLSSESTPQTSVSDAWFLAGWAGIRIGGDYVESLKFPLKKTLFYLPSYDGMELWFKPTSWLGNITFQLEAFRGEWQEKTKSSAQFVLDVLDDEGSPLLDLRDQIEQIPDQITETFEILLDAGETP